MAFLLPFCLGLLIYAHLKIAPFGSNTMVYSDAEGQYISYFSLYQDILSGDADWNYSFSKLLGGSLAGLIAYYLASPLNLILLLFPKEKLPLAMDYLYLLKVGLCGLTMAIYLNRTKGLQWISLMLSTAYAFCGYNIAYGWCTMWIDGVVLLPLICLGIEWIWNRGTPFLYVISLGLSIMACFYTGYMICLFSVLYFAFLFVSEPEKLGEQKAARLKHFVLASLLAGGLSAFILLPGVRALSGGVPVSVHDSVARFTYPMALKILGWIMPGAMDPDRFVLPCLIVVSCLFGAILFYIAFILLSPEGLNRKRMIGLFSCIAFFVIWYVVVDYPVQLEIGNSKRMILSKFIVGYVDFKEFYNGSPNVYIGSLGFMLALCFFGKQDLSTRRRVAGFLLFGALLLSISYYIPNVVWHGFEKNNCFNYRYSFVFCFTLLMLAGDCLRKMNIPVHILIMAITGCFLCFFFSVLRPIRFWDGKFTVLSLIFIVLGSLALLWARTDRKGCLTGIFVIEICAVLLTADMSLAEHTSIHSLNQKEFATMMTEDMKLFSEIKEVDSDFYRIRRDGGGFSYNDPMLFNYPGLMHFSSSEKLDTIRFLGALGQQTLIPYWANGDMGESRALDTLLGVRYFLGENIPGYDKARTGAERNPYALPLSFMASPTALEKPAFVSEVPLNLNLVYSLLCGHNTELFTQVSMKNRILEITSEDPLYLFNPDGNVDKIEVWSDGEMIRKFNRLYSSRFAMLDAFEPGSRYEFRFVDNDGLYIETLGQESIYIENTSALEQAARWLMDKAPEIHMLRASKIDLQVEADEDKAVVLSIPDDEGWAVKLDGRNAEKQKALGLLLAVPVSEGSHHITLQYSAPGQTAGAMISLISAAACIVWLVMRKHFFSAF